MQGFSPSVAVVTLAYPNINFLINEVVLQGLSGNPTAVCFGLLFGDRNQSPEAVARARKQQNFSLLAVDGAVLGTVESDWRPHENAEHSLHGLAVQTGELKGRTVSPKEHCKFLLGDFTALGKFLARQLSQLENIPGDKSAR